MRLYGAYMARSNAMVGACCRQAPLEHLPNIEPFIHLVPVPLIPSFSLPTPSILFPWPAEALRAFLPAQKHRPAQTLLDVDSAYAISR